MITNNLETNRIVRKLAQLRATGRKSLMPYIMAGDPALPVTEMLIPALADAGADLLELGVPYSDPLMDGSVIQHAAQRALDSGTTVREILETVRRVRKTTDIPINLMTAYNLLYRFPLAEFVTSAVEAGVDGLIVPDLPVEEATELVRLLRHAGMCFIPLVAPTSTPERLQAYAELASGFIYCISLTGVTGERQAVATDLGTFLARVRAVSDLPLVVGFGISSVDHVRQVADLADGVIVGSAVVRSIARCEGDPVRITAEVPVFVRELAKGLQ